MIKTTKERRMDLDFKLLKTSLREEIRNGRRCTSGSSSEEGGSISDLKFQIETMHIDIRQMAKTQLIFEEEMKIIKVDNLAYDKGYTSFTGR
ncbi:hypothetical protein KUTeg_001227 [Tegillarca granosa]|uniref:Uncharacterized protein n=1 Tax=Tegillarca granosa TaxID=220873 RepID=A0ABQ9FVG3_TEGGR|nr:hypothetical protein KUTeg_001227 [Tegillarca granosa]